jgi:uncharacterized protein YjbJ (UPF0337 family)
MEIKYGQGQDQRLRQQAKGAIKEAVGKRAGDARHD